MTRLGPAWVCQPVVGTHPQAMGSHVFCWTYRSDEPLVLIVSRQCGLVVFEPTCESIGPKVAIASVELTYPGISVAGVASAVPAAYSAAPMTAPTTTSFHRLLVRRAFMMTSCSSCCPRWRTGTIVEVGAQRPLNGRLGNGRRGSSGRIRQ